MSEEDYHTASNVYKPSEKIQTPEAAEDLLISSLPPAESSQHIIDDSDHKENVSKFLERGLAAERKQLEEERLQFELEKKQMELQRQQLFEERSRRSTIENLRSVEGEEYMNGASFYSIPHSFLGVGTKNFGNTDAYDPRKMKKKLSPFQELKQKAMDPKISFEDRTQTIRYMLRIPVIHKYREINEAMVTIINDTQYPFDKRYHFFSNNDKYVKLDYEVVNFCHRYIFDNFESLHAPIIYRILSAQHILTQFPAETFNLNDLQNFLITIAKDKDQSINLRAQCSDILDRAGYAEAKTIGRTVITELGELYDQNKQKTIYTNSQNVHDNTITEQTIKCLRKLIETTIVKADTNTGQVYDAVLEFFKYEPPSKNVDIRKSRVVDSLQRVIIDTSRYESKNMVDIILLVWEKINASPDKMALIRRLVEELDMDQSCSTGYLSRILNVLSGFFEDMPQISISFKDQLRSNVFARIRVSTGLVLSNDQQSKISLEMTSDEKPTILEFLTNFSPYAEFLKEFVTDTKYMTLLEFDEIYNQSIGDYFGIHYYQAPETLANIPKDDDEKLPAFDSGLLTVIESAREQLEDVMEESLNSNSDEKTEESIKSSIEEIFKFKELMNQMTMFKHYLMKQIIIHLLLLFENL